MRNAARAVAVLAAAVVLTACQLPNPPGPPPKDSFTIDRDPVVQCVQAPCP